MTSKGQGTNPKALRQQLGLGQGSRVCFELVDAHIEGSPWKPRQSLPAIGFGLLKGRRPPVPVGFDAASATLAQRLTAQRRIESGQDLVLAMIVALELKWVLRGLEPPLAGLRSGLDFADALHHAHCRDCETIASLAERGFVRRIRQLNLPPRVVVPAAP